MASCMGVCKQWAGLGPLQSDGSTVEVFTGPRICAGTQKDPKKGNVSLKLLFHAIYSLPLYFTVSICVCVNVYRFVEMYGKY